MRCSVCYRDATLKQYRSATGCSGKCLGSVPVAMEAGDMRMWHRCSLDERGDGSPALALLKVEACMCGETGEAARQRAALVRAQRPPPSRPTRRKRVPAGGGGELDSATQRMVDAVLVAGQHSAAFMPLLRAAAGRPPQPGDEAVRAVRADDFAALVPEVAARLAGYERGGGAVVWGERDYLDASVQGAILYGSPQGPGGQAGPAFMAALERWVRAVVHARLVRVAQSAAGHTGRCDGGGEGGGAGDGSVLGAECDGGRRFVERLDVRVSNEELERLFERPQVRPFIARRNRRLVAEVVKRALRAAASGEEEAVRVLLALPRLMLGNRRRVQERCLALLYGGEGAQAVLAEALMDGMQTDERERGEEHVVRFDPVSRAQQLARMGQVVAALRLMAESGAHEFGEVAREQPAGEAGAAPPAAPAAPAGGAGAGTAVDVAELVDKLLPADRGGETDPRVLAAARALPRVQVREGALAKVKWGNVLRALEPGKAAGCDAWRNEHFLSLMGAGREVADEVADAFGEFARCVCEGRLAEGVRPYFNAARIAVIPKADGSPRPLGVVGVIRRAIARAAVRAVLPGAAQWLTRRGQFGVGAPAGTEALARATQRGFDGGEASLLIDRKNAYGSTRADLAAEALSALVPELRGLVQTVVASPALIGGAVGGRRRWLGLFMGCPVSPLAYAVAIECSVDSVREQLEGLGVTSRGFLDDGTLTGRDPGNVLRALRLVEEAGRAWGQSINAAKCVLLVPAGQHVDAQLLGAVRRTTSTKLVGVPVGEEAARKQACETLVEQVTKARRRLGALLPKAAGYYLLRKAEGLPKLMHLIRAMPPAVVGEAAEAYDKAVEQDVAHFAGVVPAQLGPLRATTWLPFRVGGRGVSSMRLVAGAAYAAACVQIFRLEQQRTADASHPDGSEHLHGRPSGRPDPAGAATRGLCGGKARCSMPSAVGCAHGYCAVCCAILGACAGVGGGCAERVAQARATEVVRQVLTQVDVWAALTEAAELVRVPRDNVVDAFAVAAQYRAPQRAMTCALLSLRVRELAQALQRAGTEGNRALRVWRAASCPTAYAVWTAAPTAVKMSDEVFRLAMRQLYDLPILKPDALTCVTNTGRAGKTCPLRGASDVGFARYAAMHPRAADEHALTCKCGGGLVRTHDYVAHTCATVVNEWGVHVALEDRSYLPGAMRVDMSVPMAGEPGALGLAVDFTRVYRGGDVHLERKEAAKEEKYGRVYQVDMTVKGFAFSEFFEIGKSAMAVVDRLVALGVRATGSHPDDLRAELLARMGAATYYGNASQFAHFAMLNKDYSRDAPCMQPIAPSGMVQAMGARGRLTGYKRRAPRGRRGGRVPHWAQPGLSADLGRGGTATERVCNGVREQGGGSGPRAANVSIVDYDKKCARPAQAL